MSFNEILGQVQDNTTIGTQYITTQIMSIFGNLGSWQLGFVICLGLYIVYWLHYKRSIHVDVPTLGASPIILGAWIQAFRFVWDSAALIEDGVRKYGPEGKSFKISTPARWVTITTSMAVIKELGNADETVLSMQAAANQRNSIDYTLSSSIHGNPYHVELILKNLTQRLGAVLPEVVDEVRSTFHSASTIGKEWAGMEEDLLSRCICATTNRVLVGLPLCRDPEYVDCLVELSKAVSQAGLIIDLVPRVFKSIIAYFLVHRSSALKTFLSKLGPVFEARRKKLDLGEDDDDENTPNDAVKWILQAAPPDTSLYELCIRILYLDFSAIHTSTVSLMQALYDLAAHPEFQDPIRNEIESVLSECGGWTKQALTKMKKLDSSLKESQRLHPVTTATMMRRAQKPHTLVDGTFLPKGQWVVVPAYSINRSAENHSDPDKFDAFRSSRLRELAGHETRHQMASPEKGFLSFGIGKHACPGRFFAVAELKILLAYIICNYDFKIEGKRPPSKFFSFSCLPDFSAELLFRKRGDSEKSFVNRRTEAKD